MRVHCQLSILSSILLKICFSIAASTMAMVSAAGIVAVYLGESYQYSYAKTILIIHAHALILSCTGFQLGVFVLLIRPLS